MAAALRVSGVQMEIDAPEPSHALRLFFLMFHRGAFLAQPWDTLSRSYHAFALNEARVYEEKVSQDLGARVFRDIFPALAQALAAGDLHAQTQSVGVGRAQRQQYTRAYLDEVREAALILLYRLLFLFYTEDRALLPVRDGRYAPYSVRRLRERVRDDVDAGKTFASKLDNIWRDLKGVFFLIDEGDDAVGMPAYNGGLFDRSRAPLLERTRVADAVMAPIIDALSLRTEDLLRGWINYRDLSVAHLGGIYERLLEYTLDHEVQAGDNFGVAGINRIVARPASFARKVSGSYYTHDDLVRLILRESVGLLANERMQAFVTRIDWRKRKSALNPADWEGVDKNPMAVELAKTALWLHTFTVGAPLSFLDHHLKCGDSLHCERLSPVQASLSALGMLFQQADLARLETATRSLGKVADLTDVDIAEARLSKEMAAEAQEQVAPLHALLDFWRSLRWLAPGWPVDSPRKVAKLGDAEFLAALAEIFSPQRNLVGVLATSSIEGEGAAVEAANALMARSRDLAARERFFHWWTAFPTVFSKGFDAIIGNPPWDRIKLQEVEWFAERDLAIAAQARAADRKRMIGELQKKKSPLWREYQDAVVRAEANACVLGKSGDYPLLGGGHVNLYSLFVERAQGLVRAEGVVALLTPSGIAADNGAAEFFRGISGSGRLGALFDFENRYNPGGGYFPDVDSRFKFCTIVFGGERRAFAVSRCAFFLHNLDELGNQDRVLEFTADDFKLVNPNTGAAPIFRTRRDAEITTRIYRENPVLVDRSDGDERRVWPVKYATMFHMTNDSHLFLNRAEVERQGMEVVPLYEGKMVQMYDHLAADVVVNVDNLHRAAQPEPISAESKSKPDRYPRPQFFVRQTDTAANPLPWALGFKEITAPTNARTMIAMLLPGAGFGNKVPLLVPQGVAATDAAAACALLVANLNSFALDFALRQKLQGQTINLFILEQLPVIAPERFQERIGKTKIADFVREQVLHLTYTAHDMAPFARDLGFDGPPFVWDEERRRRLAALDALFMHLYGLGEDDAGYVLDTFPIVREQDEAAFGEYRTKKLILASMSCIGERVLAV